MYHTKGNTINGEMGRMLIDDVQTAVGDMVELIKTYRSKRKLSQVIVSTMFKRRLAETEAVIDRAISDLKVSLFARFYGTRQAANGCPSWPYRGGPLSLGRVHTVLEIAQIRADCVWIPLTTCNVVWFACSTAICWRTNTIVD